MMATTVGGKILCTLGLSLHQQLNTRYNKLLCPLLQVRNYAARKGTREKAKKKKVKVEVKKIGFIPHNLRFKKTEAIRVEQLRFDDFWKSKCQDDVWLRKYHKERIYSFADAIQCHRETHHPTCYDMPNAFVYAYINLDMQAEKAKKLVESFNRSVDVPCPFDHGETRNIIAFSKTADLLQMSDEAGASLSGGTELIAQIQTGEVSINDFYAAVAHPDIMAELSVIRGIMKRKFPNPKLGTLGLDLASMIKRVKNSMKYVAKPHERQPLFGTINVPIGHLEMKTQELEKNFIEIINDVEKAKPKREGPFITKVCLKSPPSPESLKVDFEKYFKSKEKPDSSYDSDEEDEVVSNVA